MVECRKTTAPRPVSRCQDRAGYHHGGSRSRSCCSHNLVSHSGTVASGRPSSRGKYPLMSMIGVPSQKSSPKTCKSDPSTPIRRGQQIPIGFGRFGVRVDEESDRRKIFPTVRSRRFSYRSPPLGLVQPGHDDQMGEPVQPSQSGLPAGIDANDRFCPRIDKHAAVRMVSPRTTMPISCARNHRFVNCM